MKLRTQLMLLVAGIVVVPIVVTASVLFLQYMNAQRNDRGLENGLLSRWMQASGSLAARTRDLHLLAERRPPGTDFVLVSPDDTILFSTIGPFTQGDKVHEGQVLQFLQDNARTSLFHIDAPRQGAAGEPLLLVRMPRESGLAGGSPLLRMLGARTTELALYTSLGLLVVSSLASFWIVRRFNGSVMRLEAATRRVADGELDYQLPVKGRDEVSSLASSFDRMRQALKEEFARRSRFIMGVSHDLRTPLSLIKGYVEAVADGYAREPEEQRRYLSIVQEKVRVLEGMVGDLIELVRMETGEWQMTHRSVALVPFLRLLGQRYTEDAQILRRQFSYRIDLPDATVVTCDEALLTRALENLLGNAIRYTPEGGRVELVARLEYGTHGTTGNGQVPAAHETAGSGNGLVAGAPVPVIVIRDTGSGIPAEELPRIYDPFYRGTNSRREQGFGLGLSTVKSIVEGHGWTIEARSEPGRGTELAAHIPYKEAE